MSNVAEVILFYSKFSKQCAPCIEFVMRNKLPVIPIPLDTKDSREYVSNGSIMQIKNVPSMIVSYFSGETQLYVGSQKIIAWFTAMTMPTQRSPPNPDGSANATRDTTSDSRMRESEYSDGNRSTESAKRKPKKKKKVKHIKTKSNSPDHTELVFDDDENTTIIDDSNNIYAGGEIQPHNAKNRPITGASKFSTVPSKASPNESIMAMAKKMEADRAKQLNIKNENG